MRKLYFVFSFCISLFLWVNAFAYDARYKWYMDFMENIPRDVEEDLNSLVRYLSYPMQNDYDKAQAFAYWIASHVIYDKYLYNHGSKTKLIKDYENQSPEELLTTRVGICGDFAKLFQAMCDKAGVRAGYVRGYVFEEGDNKNSRRDRANNAHAWNYFVYKGTKVYVDTTFMAKGKLEVDGRVSKFKRKRAIRKNQKENRRENTIYPIDSYYFDFAYKDEYKSRGHKRMEREDNK